MQPIDYTNLERWMAQEGIDRAQLAVTTKHHYTTVTGWISKGQHFNGESIQRIRDTYHLTANQVDAFFFGGALDDAEQVDPNDKTFLYALALAGQEAQRKLEGGVGWTVLKGRP